MTKLTIKNKNHYDMLKKDTQKSEHFADKRLCFINMVDETQLQVHLIKLEYSQKDV